MGTVLQMLMLVAFAHVWAPPPASNGCTLLDVVLGCDMGLCQFVAKGIAGSLPRAVIAYCLKRLPGTCLSALCDAVGVCRVVLLFSSFACRRALVGSLLWVDTPVILCRGGPVM